MFSAELPEFPEVIVPAELHDLSHRQSVQRMFPFMMHSRHLRDNQIFYFVDMRSNPEVPQMYACRAVMSDRVAYEACVQPLVGFAEEGSGNEPVWGEARTVATPHMGIDDYPRAPIGSDWDSRRFCVCGTEAIHSALVGIGHFGQRASYEDIPDWLRKIDSYQQQTHAIIRRLQEQRDMLMMARNPNM